jgi:hypothetical protein
MQTSKNILIAIPILLLIADLSAGSPGALPRLFSHHRRFPNTQSRSLEASGKLSSSAKSRSRSDRDVPAEVMGVVEDLLESEPGQFSTRRLAAIHPSRQNLLPPKTSRYISKSVLNI